MTHTTRHKLAFESSTTNYTLWTWLLWHILFVRPSHPNGLHFTNMATGVLWQLHQKLYLSEVNYICCFSLVHRVKHFNTQKTTGSVQGQKLSLMPLWANHKGKPPFLYTSRNTFYKDLIHMTMGKLSSLYLSGSSSLPFWKRVTTFTFSCLWGPSLTAMTLQRWNQLVPLEAYYPVLWNGIMFSLLCFCFWIQQQKQQQHIDLANVNIRTVRFYYSFNALLTYF